MMWRKWKIRLRRLTRRILRHKGPPDAIARGTAIGVFIAFTPTIGLQMLLGAFFATLCRANRPAAILPAWISNPVTIPPIFYFNYRVGAVFFPSSLGVVGTKFDGWAKVASEIRFLDLFVHFGSFCEQIGDMFSATFALGGEILTPLLLGSVIVGAAAAAVSYPLMLKVVVKYREMKEHERIRKVEARRKRFEQYVMMREREEAPLFSRDGEEKEKK